MKISLKSFLISICVVGAVIGVMTRLFLESPKTFLNVLDIGTTVVPFLLAVATIIWVGLRSAPRNRRLIVWGCILLLTPVIAAGALSVLWPTRNPLRVLSTQKLIANRLPNQADEPWVWQELERRLTAGELTSEQVDSAISELTAQMKKSKPAGWNQPLSWQRQFLDAAKLRKLVSKPVYLDLCEAFYGPVPTVQVATVMLDESDAQIEMEIEYGNPWSNSSGIDSALIWDLKQVRIDGQPLQLRNLQKHFGRSSSAAAHTKRIPGAHDLEFQFDCALIDPSTQLGTDLTALTPDQCPQALKRWASTVTVPVTIPPPEETVETEANGE